MATCGIINGVPTACTGNNECCCGGILSWIDYDVRNTCGTTMYHCNSMSQENLCGPLTNPNGFGHLVKCPKQVNEYNSCKISDWGACDGTNKIRTRTRTQSTNGGTACTSEQNALPVTQYCNNCEISSWGCM